MPTFSEVQLLRGRGMTFHKIGQILGVSRQRVHSIFTGYMQEYKQSEKYKKYFKEYIRQYNGL